MNCRQAPQGEPVRAESWVATPIALKRRTPSLTARTKALRSAQIVRPIRAVLDVDALEGATVLRDQDGADGEFRVGRVRALAHLASPFVEREVVGGG